jgi:Large polyvalent protein-associated domain 7
VNRKGILMATPEQTDTPDTRARLQNSIRPAKSPRKQASPDVDAAQRASATASGSTTSNSVPEAIAQRFVQVKNKFYFPDGARAFTDRGNRLTTPSENTEVVRSLIGIAQARGWNEITVKGTERFRKEAWFAAELAGLSVRGYQPTEFEQGHLVRTLAREKGGAAAPVDPNPPRGSDPDSVSRATVGEESPRSSARTARADRGGLLVGKLVDHGRATYQHDPRAAMSYFVKLETPRGERVIWGVDLERAFKESLTKPEAGDEVGLRAVRQEAVRVKTPTLDSQGNVTGEKDLDALRNHWIAEKREFFESRAAAARTLRDISVEPKQATQKHPELVGTYLQVHAAELAAKRIRDPQDRALFVAKVRSALADSVARGEPLPPLRVRERAPARTPDPREREPAPARG